MTRDVINKGHKGLTFGVGVNDADYNLNPVVSGRKVRCVIYQKWKSMLERCYSKTYHGRYPTYIGCTVCEEWKLFSAFRKWLLLQDWEGNQLDKDFLTLGNKVYSPETCILISNSVNSFIIDRSIDNGLPRGVVYRSGRYISQCRNPLDRGTSSYVGSFSTPDAAYRAFLSAKSQYAELLASVQTDCRISTLLRSRYVR